MKATDRTCSSNSCCGCCLCWTIISWRTTATTMMMNDECLLLLWLHYFLCYLEFQLFLLSFGDSWNSNFLCFSVKVLFFACFFFVYKINLVEHFSLSLTCVLSLSRTICRGRTGDGANRLVVHVRVLLGPLLGVPDRFGLVDLPQLGDVVGERIVRIGGT